jgi:hypothetical protein
VLSETSTSIILGLHHFSHEDANTSFRGSLKMFLNLGHESLGILWILRKSPSYNGINGIVHNHKCHPVRPLPLGLNFLLVILLKHRGDVIIILSDELNRLVLMEGMVPVHDGHNHLNVSLPLSKVHPPTFQQRSCM